MFARFLYAKEGRKKSPNTNAPRLGRPLKKPPAVGKRPAPDIQRTASSCAKIQFQRTARRWIDSLSNSQGVILDFMACKILLVVILNTALLLSSALKFGVEGYHLGVQNMTYVLNQVSDTTGVARSTLSGLWTSTT